MCGIAGIIDPATLKVVGSVPTGQEQSHMLAITRDGRRGYTANVGPGTVSVLDLEARRLITIIPVSPQVQRISLSVDDSLVFTSDVTKPQLAVIDPAVMGPPIVWLASPEAHGVHDERIVAANFAEWLQNRNA